MLTKVSTFIALRKSAVKPVDLCQGSQAATPDHMAAARIADSTVKSKNVSGASRFAISSGVAGRPSDACSEIEHMDSVFCTTYGDAHPWRQRTVS